MTAKAGLRTALEVDIHREGLRAQSSTIAARDHRAARPRERTLRPEPPATSGWGGSPGSHSRNERRLSLFLRKKNATLATKQPGTQDAGRAAAPPIATRFIPKNFIPKI